MSRVIVIVQARLGSTRFPGKILSDIAGRSMIWRVLERAILIPGISGVVLAAPLGDLRYPVPAGVQRVEPHCDEADVLRRFWVAAGLARADVIVRLTGDSPCLDPALVGELLRQSSAPSVEYAHNLDDAGTASFGTDAEVFTRHLLDRADDEATDPYDREHVTPWIRRHASLVRWVPVIGGPGVKLSVDTEKDLALVREVYARIGRDLFSWDEARTAAADILAEQKIACARGIV